VTQLSIPGGAYDDRVLDIARSAGYQTVFNSVEGYNDEGANSFLLQRFTLRAYSDVSLLTGICEHPARTKARLAMKRAAVTLARAVMGEASYRKLREAIISRLS
jgi:hypothetical protein